MIFSWIFMIPLAILIMVLMLPGIDIFIGLLIILLIVVEMWLIDILLKYAFGQKWGFVVKVMYYALGFFQSLSLTFNPTMTTGRLITLNLFTMTQFSAFGGIVLQAQNIGFKIGFDNIADRFYFGFSMMDELIMVGGFCLLYLLLFIYIIPLKVAVDEENPMQWYYPCICGCLRRNRDAEAQVEDQEDEEAETIQPLLGKGISKTPSTENSQTQDSMESDLITDSEKAHIANGVMEKPLSSASQSRLMVENLIKKFHGKKAVNNLSLTLFKDEILVLLGHNGAGKTTTINMLTGLIKPNSGSATALNILPNKDIDLFKDYENMVDFLGVCPQEDVLIDRMTVEENLKFFCLFKAIENQEQVIQDILENFNLDAKRNTQAKDLSGGQKRKL